MYPNKQSISEGCLWSCTFRQVKLIQLLTLTTLIIFLMLSFFHNLWLTEISQGSSGFLSLSFRWSSSPNTKDHLIQLHKALQTCVKDNGDGLVIKQLSMCNISIQYPGDTPNSWIYIKNSTGFEVRESSNLTWTYDICQVLKYWKEAWSRGPFMTKEILDCYLKKDNLDEVMYHIVSGGDCTRIDTCVSRVRHFLPDQQYFTPGQARTCALVGNSANLMSNISFADEIDSHDLVIRVNDARTDKSFVQWSGRRTSIRFINERVTKALHHIVKKNRIKNEIIVLRRALGGKNISKNVTKNNEIQLSAIVHEHIGGLKADKVLGYSSGYLALNIAAFICKTVDMYGFSIDPGPQSSWSRYFSNPRFGHSPLRHKAYYHLLECLQIINLKSPSKVARNHTSSLPSTKVIQSAYDAILVLEKTKPTKLGSKPIERCEKTNLSNALRN